jgi:hypothetical protein
MSIFNEPINPFITGSLAFKQKLMGKENKIPLELSFLNSQTSWIKLQSSVEIIDSPEAAKDNVLFGGTLSHTNKDGDKPERWDLRDGVASFEQNINPNNAYTLFTQEGDIHTLGLKPMPGITSLRVESIGAYGSTRKATINFQCWDIKQLEIFEALYMRPGYTVLLEFGRTSYIKEGSKKPILVNPRNNFFNDKITNLHDYLTTLYRESINQNGHYDAFFGYVVNYKWSYRSDGGYDCMTEIISTGEVVESIKLNYSLAGAVQYTTLGSGDLEDAANAPFKGLFLNKYSKVAPEDILRFNNEYSENILSGLIYELYTTCRYEHDSGSFSSLAKPQSKISIPKRYHENFPNNEDKFIKVDYSRLKYASTSDEPLHNRNQFLFGKDNYFVTLDSFCNLVTEYVLPYSYDGTFKTQNGNLTAISTNSRIYPKKVGSTPKPLLCLYNSLMLSTNPDVCWIKNDEWVNIVKNSKPEIDQTPPSPITYSNRYVNASYSSELKEKIIGWINDIFYDYTSFRIDAVDILQDILNYKNALLDPKNAKGNNYLTTDKEFYEALQANYQIIRGGLDNKRLRNWVGLKVTTSKLTNLPDYLRLSYGRRDSTFSDLISGLFTLRFIGPLAFRSDLKQVLNALQAYGKRDRKLDIEIQNQAPGIQQVQQASQTQSKTSETLKQLSDAFTGDKYEFNIDFKYAKDSEKDTSLSNFGDIGNIYINLKHAYFLSKDNNLLASDQAGKNTLSLGKFFDTLIQNIQTSLGNVNNFKIHIDPIDGIARIIDLNYINKDVADDLFTFNIGNDETIVRDLKLESQIFSNQISMIAISAQAEPGKSAYDNTSLTSYNSGITDRNIVAKDTPYPTPLNDPSFILKFISNLGVLTSQYLQPLFIPGTKLVTGANPALPGTFSTSTATFSVDNYYDASKSNVYSNLLRDIIAYTIQTESLLADNANKALLPNQITLTIDGLSGFVIGNLFKVDTRFIPKFYKNSARELGYTITGLNHEIAENDWTTTIHGYPIDLDSNSTKASNPKDFSSTIYLDRITGNPEVTDDRCGDATEDIRPLLRSLKIENYSSDVQSKVTPKFLKDAEFILNVIKSTPGVVSGSVPSVFRPGDPGKHGSGNAIDVQINGIDKAYLDNNKRWGKGSLYKGWYDFVSKINANPNLINTPKGNPFSNSEQAAINAVINSIKANSSNFRQTSLNYYRMVINGDEYQILNEYYKPSNVNGRPATGPHFHIARFCSATGKTPVNSAGETSEGQTSNASPYPDENPSLTSTEVPASSGTPPIGPTSALQISGPIDTPIVSSLPTPIPTIQPQLLPVTMSVPVILPVPIPPTQPTTPEPEILEAPSIKSSWKFPYYVTVKYTADGTRTNILDEMHAFQSTQGKLVGNGNVIVGDILKKMYIEGIKPIVTGVSLISDHKLKSVDMSWTITIEESKDGLAYTGFTSRGSSGFKVITRAQAQDPTQLKDPSSIKNNIKRQLGYTPQKFVEVADMRDNNSNYNPSRHIRQIFYTYTDQNP